MPYICVKGAAHALDFYKEAFGTTEIVRLTDPEGRIAHSEFRVGDAVIYMADEFPEFNVLSLETIGGSPVLITLKVPDVDVVFNRAVAAGATVEAAG